MQHSLGFGCQAENVKCNHQMTLTTENTKKTSADFEESILLKIILEGFNKKLKISQRDWRDNYTSYYIAIDGKEMFQIDITDHEDIQAAAKVFNERLDKLVL